MEEHLKHLAFIRYENFFNGYGEYLLRNSDCTPEWRRTILKSKTIGLIQHDRVLLQDNRLPEHLKLEH